MRGATIRRLVVFGVCALGVGCLYLLPSVAKGPGQLSAPQPRDQPTARRTAPASADATAAPNPSTPGDSSTPSLPAPSVT
ncbi:MAG: hypothetical protein JWP61_1382, partial [Friedmanniella sp.]|nr:hypothetical protein [Friedmanniella sp.]